jgi:predicted MarR family transcription regulator
VLDIEEPHLIAYAIRKLEKAKLVTASRVGKEKRVAATPHGAAVCARYAALREQLLVNVVTAAGPGETSLSELATLLRMLSGTYNQAARAAATL